MFELSRRNNNHQLNSYNPFREMEEWEKHFFENPFGSFFASGDLAEFKTDVTDEGNHYLLEADLPGFDKKDIQLDLSGDTLTIKAERHSKIEETDKKDKIVRWNAPTEATAASLMSPASTPDGIKAKYENGVLQLELPKKETVLPETRRLEIE